MNLRDGLRVAQQYGTDWLFWRAAYALLLRTGRFEAQFPTAVDPGELLARASIIGIDELPAKQRGRFFLPEDIRFPGRQFMGSEGTAAIRAEADALLDGKLRFFNRIVRDVGNPPDWLYAPGSAARWPDQRHWSRIPDLSQEMGDIKEVWEPARFTHVFTLIRAYSATGDQRYAETFWRHFESWTQANPPEMGPNWRCAQEMTFRNLAWLFGLFALRENPASTPERVAALLQQVWYHAIHIEKIHWYARRCVRNNHAISEAVGLFTVGVLLPWLPYSFRWQEQGLQSIARECAWQIYPDGSYIQHSMNYARLVAQLMTWTISIAEFNGIALPPVIAERAERLLEFLLAMQDSRTGRLPGYGANDGALLLPLSSCEYHDYRPALGALSLALGRGTLYDAGPWYEEAAWFGRRPTPASVPEPPASRAFEEGGYYTARGKDTHALIRCATYRHRPVECDMLHLDVWYHGTNILVDAGTFSYNPPPPFKGHFIGAAVHNTVSVDGRDQMTKGPRFMWLDWSRSRTLRYECESEAMRTLFEGECYSYAPVTHRRTVLLEEDVYTIVDELSGGVGEHTFRLHWLIGDLPLEQGAGGARIQIPGEPGHTLHLSISSSGEADESWAYGSEDPPRGWQSLYYGERTPAWSYERIVHGKSARFVTRLGPAEKVEWPLSQRFCDRTDNDRVNGVESAGLFDEKVAVSPAEAAMEACPS